MLYLQTFWNFILLSFDISNGYWGRFWQRNVIKPIENVEGNEEQWKQFWGYLKQCELESALLKNVLTSSICSPLKKLRFFRIPFRPLDFILSFIVLACWMGSVLIDEALSDVLAGLRWISSTSECWKLFISPSLPITNFKRLELNTEVSVIT